MKIPPHSPSVSRMLREYIVLTDDSETFPSAGIPVHGHYCGPGYPQGGDYSKTPRDPVDAVCRTHDKCYDREGTIACNCDRKLVADMADAVSRPGVDAPARATGLAAIAYFSASPCLCRKNVCITVPYCNWRGCGTRRVCHTVTTPGVGGRAPGCG
jgi:hypothetical protein